MAEQTLRYQSPRQFVRVPEGLLPSTARIDDWHATESLVAAADLVVDDSIKLYHIVLERAVPTTDELNRLYWSAHRLAEDIATAWCVLCGWPLKDCGMGGACDADPPGWTSNHNEVSVELQRQESPFVIAASAFWSYRCVTFPFMPLVAVVELRDKLVASSATIQELARLFRQYREADDLMLLSKALEIVGRHFGKTRISRK